MSLQHGITLVIRLWPEENEANLPTWRGVIDCVQTGDHVYFQGLDDLKLRLENLASRSPSAAGKDASASLSIVMHEK